MIRLSNYIKDYFKDEHSILTDDIILCTYKIESVKVNYEIDAYSISAYLIDKYKPKFNPQKRHYKNIKSPNIYNESDWELVRIIHPDIVPIQENLSILDQYFHLLIILLIPTIIFALYIIKGII
ncbi:hypothetical protein [Clostridium sardiniense]|uniref:hypothetical protein n=1 Tax=Clostridium sardiniense TaxID=29369 RepID=UPI00195648F9|nr:hypothetical protein [Clostridium sardiniense]MBM7835577.1 hypothetical protein [Clostridium sardiniense]